MNKKQKKIIFKTLKYAFIEGESLKRNDLVSEFSVSATIHNLSLNKKGKLQYDVTIDKKIVPKRALQHIDLKFKVLPTGCKFD